MQNIKYFRISQNKIWIVFLYVVILHPQPAQLPINLNYTKMSQEVIKAEVLPLSEITTIGKVFAESGLFADVKSQAQAVVRILAGQEIGIPPFAAISGIHIIQGKPTIGAGLMASRVKGSGKYDYKVKEQTDKLCSIDFLQNGQVIGNSTFTIEDAKKAQTKNLDKFPRNMLFARAMSNGVKWFTPDIFAGPVYVPEEMTNITEDVTAEVTTVVDPLAAIIADTKAATSLEQLTSIWVSNKKHQSRPEFKAAKDQMKEKLSPKQQEA